MLLIKEHCLLLCPHYLVSNIMKVLMLAPYVTILSRPELSRNKTGFGYMVQDIANSVGEKEYVDVLVSDSVGDGFQEGNVHYLAKSYWEFLRNIHNCISPKVLFSILKKYKMERGTVLRMIYYWLISGYYNRIISRGNYDVVHIHGCNFSNEIWMKVCEKQHVKYVITLHALNSFSDTVIMEPAGKQYERDFFEIVSRGDINVSVISTGMKEKIERANGTTNCKNIYVVCNSFTERAINDTDASDEIKDKYGIPKDAKVILYAGNISDNKNQKQLVRAFDELPSSISKNTYVLFCGQDNTGDDSFKDLVKKSSYSNHFILCGGIDRNQMPRYFTASDCVVLLSVAEGFGLSLVEGMSFGKPCLSFCDIDAYKDIYTPTAMIGVDERSDVKVAEGITSLLTTSWDEAAIKEYSKKFNSGQMTDNYINLYNSIN